MSVIIHDEVQMQISWDDTARCVILKPLGFFDYEKVVQGMNMVLDTLTQRNSNKLLGDYSELKVLGKAAITWLAQDYYPRASQNGLMYIASVSPQSSVTRLSLQDVAYKMPPDVRFERQVFNSADEALVWLKSV